MTQEDSILVHRWFLEVVEDTLRIQYNINETAKKKTGESCQDRNINQSLNCVRKILKVVILDFQQKNNLEQLQIFLKKIMIREQRQLLIKDLCARLPYYVQCYSNVADHNWCILTPVVISNLFNATEDLVLKPYLRPMSSMTAEEKKFYNELSNDVKMYFGVNAESQACSNLVNLLNSHHFDYRGLINKGLALEAPSDMYKIE